MHHPTLLVFDIETLPDVQAASRLTGTACQGFTEAKQVLEAYHLTLTKGQNNFPKQLFHQIIVISCLAVDITRDDQSEHYTIRTLRSSAALEEAQVIEGFFRYMQSLNPRLVSFNGRMFDLPVLKYRAMVHGVQASWFYQQGDRWNNYTQRYQWQWHCDLLEVLSDFGASGRVRLEEVCAVLGLPGKQGIDGNDVTHLYEAGEMDAIRQYCESDVINTYLIYLRLMQHIGTLSTSAYQAAMENLHITLQKQRPVLATSFLFT